MNFYGGFLNRRTEISRFELKGFLIILRFIDKIKINMVELFLFVQF